MKPARPAVPKRILISTSAPAAPPRPVGQSISKILIRGLTARCIIGANDWERRRKQKVILDIAITTDTTAAEASDDLAQALDYKQAKNDILALVSQSRFHLLEALASAVVDLLLRDARITTVEVTLDKPGALSRARSVAIQLVRRKAAE